MNCLRMLMAAAPLLCAGTLSAAQTSSIVAFHPTPAEVAMLNDTDHPEKALASVAGRPLLTRWVDSTRGDRVRVYCFYRKKADGSASVDFKEAPRQTVFEKQLKTLEQLVGIESPESAALAFVPELPLAVVRVDYVLKEVRADLTITAKPAAPPPKPGPEQRSANVDDAAEVAWAVVIDLSNESHTGNVDQVTQAFITGPRERWSISAAVPLDKVSQLKFNQTTNQTELKEKPTSYYAAFDFTFGDAIADPHTLTEALALKFLMRASRTPFDSYGIALGLRPGAFALLTPGIRIAQVLNTFTPFVGYIRSKEDKNGAGAAGVGKGASKDIRWGVSVDIAKALEWTKKTSAAQ